MILYAKLGAAVLAVLLLFGGGFHFGGLSAKAALEALRAEQSANTAKAVLAERAADAATRATDHATETQHASTIFHIDSTPPISTPVLVFDRSPSAPICAVPGAEGEAGGVAADTAGGGREPVDGGRDIRPEIEALKKRLEKIMADYRQLDAEWQK